MPLWHAGVARCHSQGAGEVTLVRTKPALCSAGLEITSVSPPSPSVQVLRDVVKLPKIIFSFKIVFSSTYRYVNRLGCQTPNISLYFLSTESSPYFIISLFRVIKHKLGIIEEEYKDNCKKAPQYKCKSGTVSPFGAVLELRRFVVILPQWFHFPLKIRSFIDLHLYPPAGFFSGDPTNES